MKILVLMPCDEQHVYKAAAIYNNLSKKAKETTFAIPTFMDYLINGKIVGNWIDALFYSLMAAKNVYQAAEKENGDLIIIGNIFTDCKFDAIFNFQEIEEDLPYKDNFVEKIKEVLQENTNEQNFEDVRMLLNKLTKLYGNEDSKMMLHNSAATAEFLSSYLKTDPHLEEIEAKYKKIIYDFEKVKNKVEKQQQEVDKNGGNNKHTGSRKTKTSNTNTESK